ncbi:hypothetical protein SUDANB132_05268 [Streptomyces sp. enrichment culture]
MREVADAAFRPYVARIGLVPVPTEADHAANVAAGNQRIHPKLGCEAVERGATGPHDRIHYRERLDRGRRGGGQPSGHQVRATSLRTSGRPAGRSSASSRTRRASVFLGGFCTVTRRMTASFGVHRVPRSHGGRPFGGEFLIGPRLSVAAVTNRLSVAGVTVDP